MNRDGLSALLKRYLDGTCSPQEKELIDSWFEDDELQFAEGIATDRDMQEFIWQKIQNYVEPAEKRTKYPFFQRHRIVRLAVAASVIIAGSFVFFFSQISK